MDVVLKRELAEDEKELITPAVEVIGTDVEDGGDVVPDVADCNRLSMELQKGNGLVMQHGSPKIGWRR